MNGEIEFCAKNAKYSISVENIFEYRISIDFAITFYYYNRLSSIDYILIRNISGTLTNQSISISYKFLSIILPISKFKIQNQKAIYVHTF